VADLAERLASALPPEALLPPEEWGEVDGVAPLVGVAPRTVEEASLVLRLAGEAGVTVVPRGGGTRLDLGNSPGGPFLLLDLRRLNRIRTHHPEDLTLSVEAGATLEQVRRALEPHGQFLPLDPPLPERATVGGTLAVGWPGPLGQGFGLPRDWVIGMEVLLADGRIVHSGGMVVKNVTGFDLHRLFTGSLGALALILCANFKLAPLPRAEGSVVGGFADPRSALAFAQRLAGSALHPWAIEVFPTPVWGRMGLSPPAEGPAWWVAVRFGGRPRALQREVAEAHALAREEGAEAIEALEGPSHFALWSALRDLGHREPAPPVRARGVLLPSDMGALVEACQRLPAPPSCLSLQPGYGSARLVWDGSPEGEAVAGSLGRLRRTLQDLGGHLTVERAPRAVKEALGDVWGDPGPARAVMERMKEVYDPRRILNRGRFVGGL